KDNRNSIRKEVLHLIKFVKKTVAIPHVYFVESTFLESALNILSIKASLIIVSMIWNSYWIEISF
ncbi:MULTISPECIES: hypothetical protein, partial [Enterococcus]|uniref:hypothetical protein n=1 Tax=Enterococcus TaxID=1350 RepID=UPI0028930211